MPEQKQNVVGISHIGDPLVVARIVEEEFGVPEKLMLELPDDWEDALLDEVYFREIAKYFREQGTKTIIAGDPGRYDMSPIQKPWYKWLLNKMHGAAADGDYSVAVLWSYISYALYYLHLEYYHNFYSFINNRRYKMFVDVFKREQPELTIVGDLHAKDIKQHDPDTVYTRIRWKGFHRLLFGACRRKLRQALSRCVTPAEDVEIDNTHSIYNRVCWMEFRYLFFGVFRQKFKQLLGRHISPNRLIFAQLSDLLPNDNQY
jgi:hypothetical protein